jgi:hypothetical protein
MKMRMPEPPDAKWFNAAQQVPRIGRSNPPAPTIRKQLIYLQWRVLAG